MSTFPVITPPDLAEHEAYSRFWLGNLSEATMSSPDMQILIAMNIGKYGEDNCKIAYYSMLDILRWLIREGSKGSAGQAGSGAISKRKEKVGKREIEIQYDVGTSSGASSGYDKVLEGLLDNPSTIGCNPIDAIPAGSGGGGKVIIGGTGKGAFDTGTPWRRNLNRKVY